MGNKKVKPRRFSGSSNDTLKNRQCQDDFEKYLNSMSAEDNDLIQDVEFDILSPSSSGDIPFIENSGQVLPALNELGKQLQSAKTNIKHEAEEHHYSVLDMDGYQFSVRMNNGLYTLNPIRTRLKWQSGESPIFRSEARLYNVQGVPFKERRRTMRKPQISSIIDPSKSEYLEYQHPEGEWPVKGQLYITNMQILFRVNRHNITPMPFNMIYNYYFYRNAVEIVYLKGKEKRTDIFFMDEDNMRIAETFLQALG